MADVTPGEAQQFIDDLNWSESQLDQSVARCTTVPTALRGQWVDHHARWSAFKAQADARLQTARYALDAGTFGGALTTGIAYEHAKAEATDVRNSAATLSAEYDSLRKQLAQVKCDVPKGPDDSLLPFDVGTVGWVVGGAAAVGVVGFVIYRLAAKKKRRR